MYIPRLMEESLRQRLDKGRSVLLLGPRQTGKTTIIQRLPADLTISFIQPRVRLRYEKDPSLLMDEVEAIAESMANVPLVIIDEVQKVPLIMDVIQDLIDRALAKFIITGSSARKLKRGDNINLLPGRVIPLYLDPLNYLELNKQQVSLDELLIYGSLPRIVLERVESERDELLESYVSIYLEEEIRSEAIVRNLANFARFLELAATESGRAVNYSKLSQEIGVSHTTIASYYQILEDCLVVERVEPLLNTKTRRKLSKSQKYIFFDLGIRRIAAGEGKKLPKTYMGHLFEQFIALEIIRKARAKVERIKLCYWSDPNGPKVDWVIVTPDKLIPLEIKFTASPTAKSIRHLKIFLEEYDTADKGYVVCQVPRKMKLETNIYAIPWQDVDNLF